MPTYDYVCDACDHRFELFQKFGDRQKRTCTECGKKKLRRLIGSGGGVIFKGSGFYETDYRSSEYKSRQKEESSGGASSGSEGSSSPKSDKASGDGPGSSGGNTGTEKSGGGTTS